MTRIRRDVTVYYHPSVDRIWQLRTRGSYKREILPVVSSSFGTRCTLVYSIYTQYTYIHVYILERNVRVQSNGDAIILECMHDSYCLSGWENFGSTKGWSDRRERTEPTLCALPSSRGEVGQQLGEAILAHVPHTCTWQQQSQLGRLQKEFDYLLVPIRKLN